MPSVQPDGNLATPESGRGSPVLVLHAWWGLNDGLRAFCDRLAAAGYSAFAPDLYQGRVAGTIDQAEALSSELFADLDRPREDVARGAAFLAERARGETPGLAVIGFSLGAFFALDLSVLDPELVRSVVIFYGTRPGDYGASRADYLGHFAENDPYEPAEEVDGLEASLRQANRPVTFHRYPGTGHWFFEPDRPAAYNEAAAELAWVRTLAFLKGPSGQ